MAKVAAVGFGILLALCVPAASLAGGSPPRTVEAVEAAARIAIRGGGGPAAVAERMGALGLRVVGYQEAGAGERGPRPGGGPRFRGGLGPDRGSALGRSVHTAAGRKADFTLSLWLYEWQNRDGTYSEQAAISGHWRETEYRLIDAPTDVIDVRWTAGDLVYVSSTLFDGVRRDQHTNGIASYTVDDQVESWDLFVNFRPVSASVQGRWTNVFVNYTHTWLGLRLGISLGTAPQGATGTISINTDAKTWTEGTGIAFLIGSEGAWGPATAATRRRTE